MGFTILTCQHDVDLATGEVLRASHIGHAGREAGELLGRHMMLSFIAGYRAAKPDATEDDVKAAVIAWAFK